MTDDISKVVKFLLGEGELRGAWFGDEPPGALGPMPRFWWRKDLRAAFARLESATTPAEVELPAIDRDEAFQRDYIPLGRSGWEIQTKGKGSTYRICDKDGDRLAIPDVPYLHETLTRMAREVHADYATLARQLAEAKVDTAKWKSLSDAAQIGINVQHKREVRLQSQLAEATRRLGEVEEALRQISSDNHAGLRVQQIARAALTKEPTK